MIEGLNSLVNLKDLSLAHNHIKTLENMDNLPLQVLSIGNNLIDTLEQLSYLRTFSQLKAVSIAGNPVANDNNYQPFVLAHLPALVYFDYRLVSSEAVSNVLYLSVYKIVHAIQRSEALSQYQDTIEGLELQERSAERKAAEQQVQDEKGALHKVSVEDQFSIIHHCISGSIY